MDYFVFDSCLLTCIWTLVDPKNPSQTIIITNVINNAGKEFILTYRTFCIICTKSHRMSLVDLRPDEKDGKVYCDSESQLLSWACKTKRKEKIFNFRKPQAKVSSKCIIDHLWTSHSFLLSNSIRLKLKMYFTSLRKEVLFLDKFIAQ